MFLIRPNTHCVRCALCAFMLVGCSVAVGGDPPPGVRCQLEGAVDPCGMLGAGFECVVAAGASVGVCQNVECVPIPEDCLDGEDNDCDMVIDEGEPEELCDGDDQDCDGNIDEGLDADMDGASWCDSAAGEMDCDDSDAEVYPGRADDPCDGTDSDCDPSTIDGNHCAGGDICVPESCTAATCTPAQRCQPRDCVSVPTLCLPTEFCDRTASPPRCVVPVSDCRIDGAICNGAERCNPETGGCVVPMPDGTGCTYDAECESALCMNLETVRLEPAHVPGIPPGDGVCSRSCCDDSTCGAGMKCWESGSGARACIPEAVLAMGAFGVPAAEACTRTSCGARVCSGASVDAYTLDSRAATMCTDGGGLRISCSDHSQCPGTFGTCDEGFCTATDCDPGCPTGLCGNTFCLEFCGTAADCPELWNGWNAGCAAVPVSGAGSHLPVCVYHFGSRPARADCTRIDQCRDLTCRADDGTSTGDLRCRASCCHDGQCEPTEQCRPLFISGSWETHCFPRPEGL